MHTHIADPNAKNAGHIPPDAVLAFKEYRAAKGAIFLFLLLNVLAHLFFGVNGVGIPAHAVSFVTAGLLAWSLFYRIPLAFLGFWGAFCAGLLMALSYNDFEGDRAVFIFCYWLSLSILTIRMKRGFIAFFFVLSLIFLTRLI